MKHFLCSNSQCSTNRREFLTRSGMGMGALGLAALLGDSGLLADEAPASPLAAKKPHFAPKAKRVIHIFCEGGPSQVDTFDPKASHSRSFTRGWSTK